ncbi:hypothetical protein GLGCALEP_05766 [Pseudomonas sp. MM221]|nr:hypothetical protein GLGCALEP_05766 [Pseudomonas sp. MM221]
MQGGQGHRQVGGIRQQQHLQVARQLRRHRPRPLTAPGFELVLQCLADGLPEALALGQAMALEQLLNVQQAQRHYPTRLIQCQLKVRRALAGDGQAWIVAAEQLPENVVARPAHLVHLHQSRADQVSDDHHLQGIGLLDQRQA